MNVKVFSVLAAICLIVACNNKPTGYRITGEINQESGTVYLKAFRNKMFFVIDSATITHGTFSFAGKLEHPDLFGITQQRDESPYFIFLENSDITVKVDTANRRRIEVEGSSAHDLFTEYQRTDKQTFVLDSFVVAHPASIVTAYILYRDYSYKLSKDKIEQYLQLLDPLLYQTQYVGVLQELVKTLEAVNIGKPAPDFTLDAPDGKPIKLSDKWGNGYLLIDFWAAWCGPCRRENPNVVAVYNKYRDKGFDIIGVSLDHNKESWEKAIEQDKLTWTHVSDLKYWDSEVARLYGVRAIPSNYLIDRDGIIVAKNLRGEDLDKLIGTLLEK
ncbi:MAG: AhpC/TSA family protein [Tannerellaceae bacterium]|jgi:peroxiredoxin|nr:AhpC/TSA family protein [Tannerellaceae bacterium]